MNRLLFPFLFIVLVCSARAQTLSQGPRSPGTTANVAIAGSSQSWTNTGNIVSSNNVYATTGNLVSNGDYTDYLRATNFGFSIPVPATIVGIVVEVERNDVTNQRISDFRVRIVKGGTIGTTDKATTTTWPSTDAYATYGSSTDLWGLTWADTDINATGFGVAIAANRKSGGPETTAPSIDHIRITVYYNTTIPVKLVNFSASPSGNDAVQLKWTTASEQNNARFLIERSADGSRFSIIDSLAGRGNSNILQHYTYTDATALKGIVFYRLRQTDTDGRSSLSGIVAVRNDRAYQSWQLFPNPVKAGSVVRLLNPDTGEQQLVFYSAAGARIYESNAANLQLPSQIFKSGIYYYTVMAGKNALYKGVLKVE
jgi:hypothetical protein